MEKTDTGVVSNRTGLVAGNVSDWAGYPKWRANTSLVFSRNNWSVGAAWRYIDAMKVFDVIEFDNVHTTTGSVNYFDVFGSYSYKNLGVTLGVQNLNNRTPPYVTDVANNTSAIYDYLGRFYYMRANIRFE